VEFSFKTIKNDYCLGRKILIQRWSILTSSFYFAENRQIAKIRPLFFKKKFELTNESDRIFVV